MWESSIFNMTTKCYSKKAKLRSHLSVPTEILQFSVSVDPDASPIGPVSSGNGVGCIGRPPYF